MNTRKETATEVMERQWREERARRAEPCRNGEVRVVKMPMGEKLKATIAMIPAPLARAILSEIAEGKRCSQCGDWKPNCTCVIDV